MTTNEREFEERDKLRANSCTLENSIGSIKKRVVNRNLHFYKNEKLIPASEKRAGEGYAFKTIPFLNYINLTHIKCLYISIKIKIKRLNKDERI